MFVFSRGRIYCELSHRQEQRNSVFDPLQLRTSYRYISGNLEVTFIFVQVSQKASVCVKGLKLFGCLKRN